MQGSELRYDGMRIIEKSLSTPVQMILRAIVDVDRFVAVKASGSIRNPQTSMRRTQAIHYQADKILQNQQNCQGPVSDLIIQWTSTSFPTDQGISTPSDSTGQRTKPSSYQADQREVTHCNREEIEWGWRLAKRGTSRSRCRVYCLNVAKIVAVLASLYLRFEISPELHQVIIRELS